MVLERKLKLRCREEGCAFTTWNEVGLKEHELTPHVECETCSRFMTQRAFDRHHSGKHKPTRGKS